MEDLQIIDLYWERNERAIPETDTKYGHYCTTIAKNILGNIEDTEECVNDTYLNTWNSLPPNRPNMLSAFLAKITRNLAINMYKRSRTEKRGGGEIPAVLDELEEVVSGNSSVEQEIDKKELVAAIQEFLDNLASDKRMIFVKRYWYAASVNDIADEYDMKPGTVSVQLSRTRDKLQEFLKERGFEI